MGCMSDGDSLAHYSCCLAILCVKISVVRNNQFAEIRKMPCLMGCMSDDDSLAHYSCCLAIPCVMIIVETISLPRF